MSHTGESCSSPCVRSPGHSQHVPLLILVGIVVDSPNVVKVVIATLDSHGPVMG